jgi:hypothetical protein
MRVTLPMAIVTLMLLISGQRTAAAPTPGAQRIWDEV